MVLLANISNMCSRRESDDIDILKLKHDVCQLNKDLQNVIHENQSLRFKFKVLVSLRVRISKDAEIIRKNCKFNLNFFFLQIEQSEAYKTALKLPVTKIRCLYL